jgi:hypothetical protein
MPAGFTWMSHSVYPERWNDSAQPTILNSTMTASGGNPNDGIHNVSTSGTYTVKINNSQITGTTSTIYSSSSAWTIQVASSQVSGGGVNGSGIYTCVFSYNASYAALNSTCQ